MKICRGFGVINRWGNSCVKFGKLYARNYAKFEKTIDTPRVLKKIDELCEKRSELINIMSAPQALNAKEKALKSAELSYLTSVVERYQEWKKLKGELQGLAKEFKEIRDPELKTILQEEMDSLTPQSVDVEQALIDILLKNNESREDKSVIVEIRPGTGGDEAAIFGYELFQMYAKLSKKKGWKFESITQSYITGTDSRTGIREAVAQISGSGVYPTLKYDIGTHRVQRVPITEAQGRVHTSTVSVVILPEAKESDIQLNNKDLKFDTYRASGAGGQHVNTTDSAVRITHIPTGTIVTCQDQRDQHQNRAKAMTVLMTKILENQRLKMEQERSSERTTQMGDADRSDKIRTYNIQQDRITDHRANFTMTGIEAFLNGKEELFDEMWESMRDYEKARKFEWMFEREEPKIVEKKKKK